MALVFQDTLEVTNGSGSYTLQALIGGAWVNLDTVSGPANGAMHIGPNDTPINVNINEIVPLQTVQFRWMDGNNSISNIRTITVPTLIIDGYTTGASLIDFAVVTSGSDGYTFGFHFNPTSIQALTGSPTVMQYQYTVNFWSSGNQNALDNGTKTGDYSNNTGANGAGVYELDCLYLFDNGTGFQISKLVKVGASGNILASIENYGATVNSHSNMDINLTANVIQSGVNYPIQWIASNGTTPTPLGTGNPISLTLPNDILYLLAAPQLDSTFTNDIAGDQNGIQIIKVIIY